MLMTLHSFSETKKSAFGLINIFDPFFLFSSLEISKEKCEITVIGVKKGVKVGLYRMECIDLTEDTIKILGIYFPTIKSLNKRRTF